MPHAPTRSLLLRSTTSTALLMALALPAAAQSLPSTVAPDSGALEEIVVTARKRAEVLQSVPLSVTAFTATQIERQHIERTEDVFRLTPGLVYDHGFSSQDTRPTIRGLPATRGRPPVGILLDGIDTSSESIDSAGGGSTADLRLIDLERVEVIKGPQSALYGRTAFGGVISYVSKKPSDTPEYEASFDVGGYGRVETRLSATGPLVEGKLAYRANFEFSHFDGFYKNLVSGQSVGGTESKGGAVALRFTPDDRLTVDARISYAEDDDDEQAAYVSGAFLNNDYVRYNLPASLIGTAVGNPATPLATSILAAKPGPITFGPVKLSINPLTGQDYPGYSTKPIIGSVIASYALTDDIKLESWTGYHNVLANLYEDADYQGAKIVPLTIPNPAGPGEPLSGAFADKLKTHTQQISQELRVSDFSSDGLHWAAGGMFWFEKLNQNNEALLAYIDNVVTGPGAIPFSGGRDLQLLGTRSNGQEGKITRHVSGYGLLEYEVLPALTLEAEGRFTHETYGYDWLSSGGASAVAAVAGPTQGLAVAVPSALLNATGSDSYFTPRFSAKYQLQPDILIYGDIARGVKPGGYLTVSSTSVAGARYQPERLWSYEVGAKTEWMEKRLLVNGSLFYLDYQNKQTSTLAPDPTSASGFSQRSVNDVSAKSMGGELESAFRVTQELTLSANYAYTFAYYDHYINLTNTASAVIQAGNCTVVRINNIPLCGADFSGRPIERTPRHQLNFGPTYRTPIFDDWTLVAEVNAQYQSKRYEGTFSQYFDDFWNLDVRLGVETPRWELFLYGENALDDRTVKTGTAGGDLSSLTKGIFVINTFGPAKAEFGLRGKVKF